ncbi:hypothetical protein ONR75_11185 [Rhodopseudomonas sp. P2A-2r]|uniref:hypothetical protein n=1 Tax=Rhodopseudomonas sp. P2A-2r TaxID=2991972 RepID=UPI002234191D|nr:hypothetical protein [Rhodopseudomonas sp. P2A-2r]UZE51120.1 hypothetical protein ONR75_11185 [Rhodopseudomonas sp. P2A-2r]
MSSLFASLTQLSSNINDSVMGERLRVTPRTAARYAAAATDDSRAVVEVVGIYREVVSRLKANDNSAGRDFDRAFMAPKIVISIQRVLLGARSIRRRRPDHPPRPSWRAGF